MHKVSYYLQALCTLTHCDYPSLLLYFTIGVAIFDDLFKNLFLDMTNILSKCSLTTDK